MNDPTAWLTLDELLAAAKAEGLDLTREQLHRWRKAGLMPTPVVRGLGRGVGRESLYPRGCLAQALMIGELLKRTRDLDVVRWRMFLDGFPVATRQFRAQLDAEVRFLLKQREEVTLAADPDDDEHGERYITGLAKTAHSRARSPFFRYLREHLGADVMPVLHLFRQLGAGAYPEESAPADHEIFDALFAADVGEPAPKEVFGMVAQVADPIPMATAFAQASDETLLQARTEFLAVVPFLRHFAEQFRGLGPVFALEMQRNPFWPPPILFLFWLRWREHPMARLIAQGLGDIAIQRVPSDGHGD